MTPSRILSKHLILSLKEKKQVFRKKIMYSLSADYLPAECSVKNGNFMVFYSEIMT
jgi:hypothetical protein